jgi:hypothetical protein
LVLSKVLSLAKSKSSFMKQSLAIVSIHIPLICKPEIIHKTNKNI